MRRAAGLLTAALLAALPCYSQSPAAGAKRRALLIANSAYRFVAPLQTPKANVEALGNALKKMRFQLQLADDLSHTRMISTVRDFVSTVQEGDFVLIYYSGYGYQADEINYLLPVDFDPRSKSALSVRASSVRSLQDQMEPRKALATMLLLDASRSCRGLPPGLAAMAPRRNTLAAFSAEPNQTVPDPAGGGVNIFTAALIAAMETPGSTPVSVAGRVQEDVRRNSGGRQLPYVLPNPIEDFVFTELAPATASSFGKAGEIRIHPKDGLKYVWIRPGKFTMGCSPGDSECNGSEKPPHEVTVTKGYWLGQTPVTQDAYQRVTGQNPSYFKGLPRPVEQVTWEEAQTYCRSLGGRLPTEAEWEYAARAGDTRPRYGEMDRIAWYRENSGGQTHAVARKEPNAWGLYDLLGNVHQWTADWDSIYESGPARDPYGPVTGAYRMLRGGSWNLESVNLRVSYRGGLAPDQRLSHIGFRCLTEALPVPPGGQITPPTSAFTAGSEVKQNSRDGQKYVWMPPGSFLMGCSSGDPECTADEKPAHEVTITAGFWLGQTPVTQQAYVRVTGQNPSDFKGADLPVERVSWKEAQAYCFEIGGRLPSEAEWEYAARAGDTKPRYGEIGRIAWHSGNSNNRTHEVGELEPNAWGLYDMLGNVWQWTQDWSVDYQAGPQSDPSGPNKGEIRVARGGAWSFEPKFVRASYRGGFAPTDRINTVGFRCVGEAF